MDKNAVLNFWLKTLTVMCWCLASKPYTVCEVSVVNLTARSMAWECEGKSGKSSLVPFKNDSRSFDSEKSSIIGGSKMPYNVKSINCVQCVTLELIVGIFLNLFLVDSPLLKEYKNLLIELSKNSNLYCSNNYDEIR